MTSLIHLQSQFFLLFPFCWHHIRKILAWYIIVASVLFPTGCANESTLFSFFSIKLSIFIPNLFTTPSSPVPLPSLHQVQCYCRLYLFRSDVMKVRLIDPHRNCSLQFHITDGTSVRFPIYLYLQRWFWELCPFRTFPLHTFTRSITDF